MKYVALFLAFLLASCEETDCGCTNIGLDLSVASVDTHGNSLLTEENFSDLNVKYLINGELVTGQQPNFHAEGETGVAVLYLHNQGNDAFPVTYVYWNAADVDTITAQLSQNRNVITKAWINGIEAITGSTSVVRLVK